MTAQISRPSLPLRVAALLLGCTSLLACTRDPQTAAPPPEPEYQWAATSNNELYRVVVRPAQGAPIIGAFAEWRITVRNASGAGVFPAVVRMSGGMPAHGHGLPTQPEVTEHLGDGEYRIEGLRFNMAGEWVLEFVIDSSIGRDQASLTIDMTF